MLLNCDYKIATTGESICIKTVLPKLTLNDKTSVLKNIFIREYIRSIDSIIKNTAAEDIPVLLLSHDFEKAFDALEWSFHTKLLNTLVLDQL